MKQSKWRARSLLVGVVCLLVLLPLVGGCAQAGPAPASTAASAAPTSAPTILKFNSLFSAEQYLTKMLVKGADRVKERSGGRLQIQVFPSDTLVPTGEGDLALRKRIADGVLLMGSMYPKRTPALADVTDAVGSLDESKFKDFMRELKDLFEPRINEYGFTTLFWFGHVNAVIPFSKKPIKTLDDFKGLTARSYGGAWVNPLLQSAGMAVTPISLPEVYMAFQRGVVDVGMTAIDTADAQKWPEVAPYAIRTGTHTTVGPQVVLTERLNELPADLRKILLTTYSEIQDEYAVGYVSLRDGTIAKWQADPKVHVSEMPQSEVTRWLNMVKVWDQLIATHGELYTRYRELIERYSLKK